MDLSALSADLEAAVGAAHVDLTPAGRMAHAAAGVVPVAVVSPGSVEQLGDCVRRLRGHGLGIVPWGGGTAQTQGHPPRGPVAVVRTGRLDRVLMHEPADLTISVEAGLTLAALDRVLAAGGLMLPVDAPRPGRATIGGLLATAAEGPRRLGYGTLRDLLIGVTVVEATGAISQAGGMVVKNVTGFDMMKLYHGSLGTLGIVVRANFKLVPRPRGGATVQVLGEPAQLLALAPGLSSRRLVPTAVELVLGQGAADGLLIRCEGLPAAVERHVRDVRQLAEGAGLSCRLWQGDGEAGLWAGVAEVAQAAELAADEAVLLVGALPQDLAALVLWVLSQAGPLGVRLGVSARLLSGVLCLRLRGQQSSIARSEAERRPSIEGILALHRGLRGRAPVPHLRVLGAGAALLQRLVPTFPAPPAAAAELFQRLRRELDPDGALNPGRMEA